MSNKYRSMSKHKGCWIIKIITLVQQSSFKTHNSLLSISVLFILKKIFYSEFLLTVNGRKIIICHFISCFLKSRAFVYRKLIAILLSFLSFSNTINTFALAQEMTSGKSSEISVGFGSNGSLLKSVSSNAISVLVKDDMPKFYDTHGESLVKISPTVGVAPQVVTFDASGISSELKCLWNFGDSIARMGSNEESYSGNSANPNISANATATHLYEAPGKYLVALQVENQNGKTATYTKEIEIRDKNEAPIVDATYTTNESDDYLEVTFDGSMTFDIENDVLTFKWETGDGSESSKRTFTYRYIKKGTFVPKVTVSDSLGASTVKYLDEITCLGPNSPPVAVLNISPSVGYLPLTVMLSGKDSFDNDGEITNYKWTISKDRSQKSEVREGEEIEYEFTEAGEYNVTLSVTDSRNKTIEKTDIIKVLKPNPIASASVDKTSGESPLSVQFSSDGSRDFDSSIVNVRWNFGDGTEDSTEPSPIHTYTKPGAYLPTLTVSTTDGRVKKTNTRTIIVSENNGPQAIISVLEPVTLGIPNEAMIKLSAKNSFDPKLNQMLSYSWSWAAYELDKNKNLVDISEVINKQIRADGEEFSYTFTAPGQYTPILEVKTEDGRIGRVNGETITILPSQDPVAIAQITSDKFSGEDTLTVNFDGSGSYDPKTDGQIVSYLWEFGDGETSSEITPVHTYNIPGTYNAKLTVQDNRGYKSTALARIVQVTSTEANTLARVKESILRLQTTEEDPLLSAQDETFSFSFSKDEEKPIDNTPPQISLWVENPELFSGETLFFKAHITDDIGVDVVGYKLEDEFGSVVLEEIEGAPGNKNIDYYMANVDYVKDVQIPEDLSRGKYKLLLFAEDKADNWLGKTDSSQIVSSEINIIGKSDDTSETATSSTSEDAKIDADVINELDSILSAEDSEAEKAKLIELIASDEEKPSLTEPSRNDIYRTTFKERGSRLVRQLGKPPNYGVPSTTSIVQTIKPVVSPIMTAPRGDSVSVSIKGTVPSNNVKNYSNVQIKISGETPASSNAPTPVVQSHLTVTCASGRDCSIFDDRLSEINSPKVSVTPQDSLGNPIGETTTLELNENKFKENAKQTPEINFLNITEKYIGSGSFELIVNGSNFDESTNILWDDIALETKYLNPNRLSVFVPATLIANSKDVQIKAKKIFKDKTFYSASLPFKVLPKQNKYFVFDTKEDLSTEIRGDNLTLERRGGNVYIDKATTVFKEAGEILLPFIISSTSNLNLEIKGEIISTSSSPIIKLYKNNKLISSLVSSSAYSKPGGTGSKSWKINIGELPVGAHTIKLSVPDLSGKTIFILDKFLLSFTDKSKPQVTQITPSSIYPLNTLDRTLVIKGKNFGENPKVYYKGNVIASKLTCHSEEPCNSGEESHNGLQTISATLPENLGLSSNDQYLSIVVFNSESGLSSESKAIGIRSPLKINSLSANYNFIPSGPSGKLDVAASVGKEASEALIGVYDIKGNEIKSPFSEGKFTVNSGEITASFELPYDLPSGSYHVLVLLKRNTPFKDVFDFSNENLKKLFNDLLEGKVTSEADFTQRLQTISNTEKASFTIGDNAALTVNLFGTHKENGVYFIQEKKEISASLDIKGNIDKSSIQTIIDFRDGTHEVNKNPAKHVYKITSGEKFKDYGIYGAIFKDGREIATSPETLLYVYKDLPPVAIAKIDTNNFELQGDAPFKAGFIDESIDPNDEITSFSEYLDKTVPEKNIWKLFKYKDGISNELVNREDLSVTGNQVLSGGKSFVTGEILNPGTYFAHLTVFDEGGNLDETQSETVQVTLPTQMLLVHASFTDGSVFEYDSNGEVKVQFKSQVQIRGNKGPKNIIYKWDFGDVSLRSVSDEGSRLEEQSQPNPIHTYKRSNNTDKIDYHPELTVTAIWPNGYSETWSSKAGTVSIVDKPEFVALDLVPDKTVGDAPLTVNFMIGENSIVKNATIVSYEFYNDGIARSIEDTTKKSPIESGSISNTTSFDSALNELKQKTFTFTYITQGEFQPILKVKTKEGKEFTFNSPIISTNSLLVSSIEVLDPPDTYITNEPIQTFKLNTKYTNPFSSENRLTIHVLDEEGNENITELNPDSSEQTIFLSEGTNTYWFGLVDSTGSVQKSLTRKIILDTTQPSISNLKATFDSVSKNVSLAGNIVENNLGKVELEINGGIPLILSSSDFAQVNNEKNEYEFKKILENLEENYSYITVRVYDIAGNIAESEAQIKKWGNKILLERISDENKSSSSVSNFIEHKQKENSYYIQRKVISGEPFDLKLFTCVNDDLTKHDGAYSVHFEISTHKFELKYNDNKPMDITSAFSTISNEPINMCFQFTPSLSCNDAYAKPEKCLNACFKLDGLACDVGVFETKKLNNYSGISSDPNFDLTKQWDIGHYELKFTIFENPASCSNYGTCLGKEFDPITSETYTYLIDVVREPKIIKSKESNNKLLFKKDNEITLKFTLKDNLSFNISANRVPLIDLQNALWTGLGDIKPNLELISGEINSNDPREFIYTIKTSIHPKSLDPVILEVPVTFPSDYFNPNGIKDFVKFNFKVIADLGAEIVSPATGEVITKDKTLLVTSKVKKPAHLVGNLPEFNNCGKSTINYKIETSDSSSRLLEKITPQGKKEKVQSLGVDQADSRVFKNKLNFNLKNIFKKDFLNGEIFGPIELFGEYSTKCAEKNIIFDGNPNTYILFDNSRLEKTKCKYPEYSEYSKCEAVVSSNTLLDEDHALELAFIPNIGVVDKERCPNPKITFENEKKLTKKITVACLPKEAASFEIRLKRSPNFLAKIQEKISQNEALMSISLAMLEEAVVADSKVVEVINAPAEENDVFQIGDLEDEFRTSGGRQIFVRDLKDILFKVGLLNESELGLGYTQTTKDAWKTFIYLVKTCDASTLRFQTTGPTELLTGSCSINLYKDENGNLIELPNPSTLPEPTIENLKQLSIWQDILNGFSESFTNNLKELLNPTTLGVISTIVALSLSGVLTSLPPVWLALGTYAFVSGGTFSSALNIANELETIYSSKSIPWKVSYAIGKLQPDLTIVKSFSGFLKNLRISERVYRIAKLDSGSYNDTAEFIYRQEVEISYASISEEAKNLKREKLENFAQAVEESYTKADIAKREEMNTLFKEINTDDSLRLGLLKKDFEENVLYRDYPKDLNGTPEDWQVIRERIYAPSVEYGAKAKASGVENGFVFRNRFIGELGSNFNLQDLQRQGFLLGDGVPAEQAPAKLYRIIEDRDPLTMLTGDNSGPVFVFDANGLTKEQILVELKNNKDNFLRSIGKRPEDLQGNLKLVELDNTSKQFNLYKPTTKDSNFDKYFRYNPSSNESFGRTLDLNGSTQSSIKEYVLKDIDIINDPLSTHIIMEDI